MIAAPNQKRIGSQSSPLHGTCGTMEILKTRHLKNPLQIKTREMSMHRRSFMKNAGLAAVGAAASSILAAPAIAQNQIGMTIVSSWPRDFPGLDTGAQRLAKKFTTPQMAASTLSISLLVNALGLFMFLTKSLQAMRKPITPLITTRKVSTPHGPISRPSLSASQHLKFPPGLTILVANNYGIN